ncbi:uncharacterized protein V6R79_025994 [Siganus canaliculatus]
MARAKTASVLCMDVGSSMCNSYPGEASPFDLAKKIVQSYVQREIFAETKDELALVLFGTDSTKDHVQHQNVTVLCELKTPDFEFLQKIENQIHPQNQEADLTDALVVCMDLLQTEARGKKYGHRNITLLTDLSTDASSEKLDSIIEQLKQAGITLQFFLPFPAEDNEEGEGDADSRGPIRSGSGKGPSREQKERLETVKQIMQSLDGESGLEKIYTMRDGIEQFRMFKRIEKGSRAWSCQLTIDNSLSIPVIGYTAVMEKTLKSWTTVDARTSRKDDVRKKVVHYQNDDNETEVQAEDTIQEVPSGSGDIPVSKPEQEMMKSKNNEKCFAVCGFTERSLVLLFYFIIFFTLVQRHLFIGNQAIKFFADKSKQHAGVALSAFIRALDQLQMVAIMHYNYSKQSKPQVGAAFPCITEHYECLIYVQLPFKIKRLTFPSLENKTFTPSEAQLSAIDTLIDSMMLEDEAEDMFKVHHIPNPAFQRHFQCLLHRAMSPDTTLPPIEPWLKAALERPHVISERCQLPLEEVRRWFPLEKVEKNKKLKDADESDAKKAKAAEEELHCDLPDNVDGSVTLVRSGYRAPDFCTLTPHSVSKGEVYQQLTHRVEPTLISQDEVEGRTMFEQGINQNETEDVNLIVSNLSPTAPDVGAGAASSCLPRSPSLSPAWTEIEPVQNLTAAPRSPEEFIPKLLSTGSEEEEEEEEEGSFRFQCSRPGLYQCSVTGLLFHMDGEGDVLYRTVPWNRRLLAQHHKQPAGPLFDIQCVQQCVRQLHLPHCEIHSTAAAPFLSVAHVTDEGVDFLRPQQVTETHLVLNISGFSAYGNVKEADSPPGPVRALVLLFYRPPAQEEPESVLKVLLLPRNVVLRDVLRYRKKLCADERYLETPSHCKLQPQQEYTLSTHPEEDWILVQPKEAEFDSKVYDEYYPSFEVILRKIIKELKLIVRDVHSPNNEWERLVCLWSAGVNKSFDQSPSSQRLLDIQYNFIYKTSPANVQTLADMLLDKKVLSESEKDEMSKHQSNTDRARYVIDVVRKKGDAASLEMIESLDELDPCLSQSLGLS